MAEQKNDPQEKPKIIVDDDWKAQAQAEKQKLSEEVQKEAASGAAAGAPGGGPQARQIPPATFTTLVGQLAAQAMMAMGGMVDRRTKRPVVDLELAKFHIDALGVLEEKTKGNLTDEERKALDEALFEVRMQYVELAQQMG